MENKLILIIKNEKIKIKTAMKKRVKLAKFDSKLIIHQ